MTTRHGRIAVAVATAVIAASVAAVGGAQALTEEQLQARLALAEFQGVDKPDWDPVRFGELAAEFGVGSTTVTARGFAPRGAVNPHAEVMQELLADAEWDSERFADALEDHLGDVVPG